LSEQELRRAWVVMLGALVAVIVFASLYPRPLPAHHAFSDKTGHYLAYLALALLGSGIATPAGLWRTMLRCFLLGLALEGAQGFLTAHRVADVRDLLANGAGIATAWLIVGWGRAGWGLRAFERMSGRRAG